MKSVTKRETGISETPTVHGYARCSTNETRQDVERQIREKLGVQQVKLGFIGPVIGAHSGPGTVALFFLGKER